LVALRLYLVRGISARKRAPHPHLKPSPVKGEGFLVHAGVEDGQRPAAGVRRPAAETRRSLGVVARVAAIPAIPFRRLSLQTYTGNAVFL
jgi:hypothetical protein